MAVTKAVGRGWGGWRAQVVVLCWGEWGLQSDSLPQKNECFYSPQIFTTATYKYKMLPRNTLMTVMAIIPPGPLARRLPQNTKDTKSVQNEASRTEQMRLDKTDL